MPDSVSSLIDDTVRGSDDADDIPGIKHPIFTSETGRILNVCNDTVHAYERRGLIKARRTRSGVRIFDRDEAEQLRQRLDEQRRAAAGPK